MFLAMFALVLILVIGPVSLHVLSSIGDIGNRADSLHGKLSTSQVVDKVNQLSLSETTRFADHCKIFSKAAEILALQIGEIYQDGPTSTSVPVSTAEPEMMKYNELEGLYYSLSSRVSTLYWGSAPSLDTVIQEAHSLQTLDIIAQGLIEAMEELEAITVITVSGVGKFYGRGQATLGSIRQFTPTLKKSYQQFLTSVSFTDRVNSSGSNTFWTNSFPSFTSEKQLTTVVSLAENADKRLVAAVALQLSPGSLAKSLEQKDKSRLSYSFLLDQRTNIVSRPEELFRFLGVEAARIEELVKVDSDYFNLNQTGVPELRQLSEKLGASAVEPQRLHVAGQNYLMAVRFLSQVKGKMVTLAREDTIFSVKGKEETLSEAVSSLKLKMLFYIFFVFFIIFTCCFLVVKYFVGPLQKLSLLAQRIGEGDFSEKSSLVRGDEIGRLSDAMNTMVDGLAEAESFKKEYFNKLQNGINERTSDLNKKTLLLSEVMRKVHHESEKRKKISLILQEREKQLLTTMEASLAGLCIIQDGTFKYVNSAIETMFGYSKEELVNTKGPIDLVAPEYNTSVMQRVLLKAEDGSKPVSAPHHVRFRRKDGEVFDVEVDGSFITWNGEPASVGTFVDISDHVKAKEKISENEERLKKLLDEKDLLLREVYHRTKNNMLVIISMLALQMDEVEDNRAVKIFEEMEHRIRAMALVHENLYQSENLVEINLGEYLAKMARTQVEHMTFSEQIEVRADYGQVTAMFDQAVPLGLVVSELITNAVKYAFPEGRKGIIRLQLKKKNSQLHLIVEDDGVGLPQSVDIDNPASFGLQITTNMIKKQLNGTFEVQRYKGTAFHIKFSLKDIHGYK